MSSAPDDAGVDPAGRDSISPTSALLLRSAQRLRQHQTVTARVRQRIRLFGQNLAGSGLYKQANIEADYLFRLQFQIAVREEPATLLQVSDGSRLWTTRSYPNERPTMTSVDLNQVRRYFQRQEEQEQGRAVHRHRARGAFSPAAAISMGGLPQLLEMLARNYEFDEPVDAELHQVNVWTITGSLSKAARVSLGLNDQETLPKQIPQAVTIALGKDDLFPFRLEFRHELPKPLGADSTSRLNEVIVSGNDRSLLVIELFEVQYNGYIDPQEFEFRPVDAEVQDVTEEFLAGLLRVTNRDPTNSTESPEPQ